MKKNADGSLTLHVQKDSPGTGDPARGQWHLAATGDRGGELAFTTAAFAGS